MILILSLSAGLGAGITEAVLVVNPMEVVKIRLQAQMHSLADPLETPQYRNAGHAVYTIVREEGFAVLYRGVTLTALRQATNQGALARVRICDTSSQRDRGELYGVSGIKEVRPKTAAGADRPANVSAYGYRTHIRCYGPIFQRTDRHHQNPYVVCHVPSIWGWLTVWSNMQVYRRQRSLRIRLRSRVSRRSHQICGDRRVYILSTRASRHASYVSLQGRRLFLRCTSACDESSNG